MGAPLVRCELDGAVATVTLASPATRNALSRDLLRDFHAALDQATGAAVRAIVLTHEPPVFCAGADLKERTAGPPDSAPMVTAIRRLQQADQPVIAALTGPVRAGGIGIMAACDLIVVAATVDFAFTEVRLGVAPAIISVPILRRVAASRLAPAFLTGERFDAATARELGLVTHVAADAAAVATVVAGLVEGILMGSPRAIAATKRLLREIPGPDIDADFDRMQALSDALFAGPDGQEGMRAFLDKRRPAWHPPT
jgi:enoyl-CoA hydratase/carnithine racemase